MELKIIALVIVAIIVALIMEWYKKDLRGKTIKTIELNGAITLDKTTKAATWEIKIVSLLLSGVFTTILYFGASLPGKPIMIIIYSIVVYFGQYYISMETAKKLFYKIWHKYTKIDLEGGK